MTLFTVLAAAGDETGARAMAEDVLALMDAQGFESARLKGRARKAARFARVARPERRPRDGGVADDQRVDALVDRRSDDPFMIARFQVRRDL